MEKPPKPKAQTNTRLDQMVMALASNSNLYPKMTESSLVATARKILAEIDKLG